jgi:Tfp pilus assembly protein PilV
VNAVPPTTGRPLPSKEELLSFQSTWIKRAGLASLLGAVIVAASIVLQQIGLNPPDGNSDADQLVFEHAHADRLIYTSILLGIGLALFAVPLTFLFRAAAGRAQRVRAAFIALVVLGPVALGLGAALSSIGSTQAAQKFHDQEPAAVQQARQQAEQAQAKPSRGSQRATTNAPTTTAGTTTAGTGSTTINLNGTTTTVATPVTPSQAGGNARENLADHINKHTTLLLVGGLVGFIGRLALVFGLIYTSLWCMRTGLLTRYGGIAGIVAGVGLILLGAVGFAVLVIWFAVVGLILLGVWPAPLPPAWEAGKAIPWPGRENLAPPGSDPAGSGTVEGSGREVSEASLPERADEPPQPPYGETQGQRRKKRKRRR